MSVLTQHRRGFLRGLASLPLIGGGVTLIGQPAAAVPLTQVAAAPILNDPRARARYAWEAFSAAMREITADADGWIVRGGERTPLDRTFAGQRQIIPGGCWVRTESVHYELDEHPHYRALLIEQHRDVDLSAAGVPIGGVS